MQSALLLLALVAGTSPAQFKISIPNASNPQAGDIVVDANKEERTLTCTKNSVFLRGNGDEIRIEGDCKSVHILGNGNTVYVETAQRIVTEGNENSVSYRNPNSGVSTTGTGNKINVARTDR